MSSDYPREQGIEGTTSSEKATQPGIHPFSLPMFAVQLQNIVPVDIMARRLPGAESSIALSPEARISLPAIQLNLEEPIINNDTQQAQVLMNIHVVSTDMPPLFEISLKLIG